MIDKFQITFKKKAVEDYPVVSRLLVSLTGSIRTKTFISTCEAFARIEGMENANPEALYHHAEEILKGFHPNTQGVVIHQEQELVEGTLSSTKTNVTETQQNTDFLKMINETINSFGNGGK